MPLRSTRLQLVGHAPPAARGESLAAFDGRCILAGCVAPPLNTPGIRGRRALPARRLARLGATPHFHHGLLASPRASDPNKRTSTTLPERLFRRRFTNSVNASCRLEAEGILVV